MSEQENNQEVSEQNLSKLLYSAKEAPQFSDLSKERIWQVLRAKQRKVTAPSTFTIRRVVLALAASLAAAFGLSWWTSPEVASRKLQRQEETARYTLRDGSTLLLHQGSFTEEAPRSLTVQRGAALIDAKPGGSPLFIHTKAGKVSISEGRFLLDLRGEEPLIVSLRGELSIEASSGKDLLRNGESASISRDGDITRRPFQRTSTFAYWARPWLSENGVRLDQTPDLLVARLPNNPASERPLPMRDFIVDVYVEDQMARVAIDQTFFNDDASPLEAIYTFSLPVNAAISRLAMYVEGKRMEAGIVEKQRARDIYESIVYQRRDPALLEQLQGNLFQTKIFPLPPQQEKRILLSYTQPLQQLFDGYQLVVPIPKRERPSEHVRYQVRIKDGAALSISSASHSIWVQAEGNDALVSFEAEQYPLQRDFLLQVQKLDEASVTTREYTDGTERYWSSTFIPELPRENAFESRHWIILNDVSASRSPLLRRTQSYIIERLLKEFDPQDALSILSFDSVVRAFAEKSLLVKDTDLSEVLQHLKAQEGAGATELELAMQEALKLLTSPKWEGSKQRPYIIYLGDGELGLDTDTRLATLEAMLKEKATVISVGVGSPCNAKVLQSLAEKTDGVFTTINPNEDITWRVFDLIATLNTTRLKEVKATLLSQENREIAGSASYLSASTLNAGEALTVASIVTETPTSIRVDGELNGQPWSQTIPLPTPTKGAKYLPRLWAQKRIEDLLQKGAAANQAEITTLGMKHFLVTPFTSLLVLESDAMYQEFKVNRGSEDDWGRYQTPSTIEVKKEQLPPTIPQENGVTRSPMESFELYPYTLKDRSFDSLRSKERLTQVIDTLVDFWSKLSHVGTQNDGLLLHQFSAESNNNHVLNKEGNVEGFFDLNQLDWGGARDKIFIDNYTDPTEEDSSTFELPPHRHRPGFRLADEDRAGYARVGRHENRLDSFQSRPSDGFDNERNRFSLDGQPERPGWFYDLTATNLTNADPSAANISGLSIRSIDIDGDGFFANTLQNQRSDLFNLGQLDLPDRPGLSWEPFPLDGRMQRPIFGGSGYLLPYLPSREYRAKYLFQQQRYFAMRGMEEEYISASSIDPLQFVPGLYLSRFDQEKRSLSEGRGSIDARSAELLQRAQEQRTSLELTTKDGTQIALDGKGIFTLTRTLPSSLVEQVFYDGKHLYQLYQELGIATKRDVVNFEPLVNWDWVPFLAPTAQEAAARFEVTSPAENTILMKDPLTKAPIAELRFNTEGKLISLKRFIDSLEQELGFSYEGGKLTVQNDEQQMVYQVREIETFTVFIEEKYWSLFELPAKSARYWDAQVATETAGSTQWATANRQRLFSFWSVRDFSSTNAVLRTLQTNDKFLISDVLFARTLYDKSLPDDIITRYFYAIESNRSSDAEVFAQQNPNTLLGMIASYRNLYQRRLSARMYPAYNEETLRLTQEFFTAYPSSPLRYSLLALLSESDDESFAEELATLWAQLAIEPELREGATLQAIKMLGKCSIEKPCYQESLRKIEDYISERLKQDQAPLFDSEMQEIFAKDPAQAERVQRLWSVWESTALTRKSLPLLYSLLSQRGPAPGLAKKIQETFGEDSNVIWRAASWFYQTSQFESALLLLQPMLEKDMAGALYFGSVISEEMGKTKEAIEYLARCLSLAEGQISPKSSRRANTDLYRLKKRLADLSEDETEIQSAVQATAKIRGEDDDVLDLDLFRWLTSKKRSTEARRYLYSIIERNPSDPLSYKQVAEALQTNNLGEAARVFSMAARAEPTNPEWLLKQVDMACQSKNPNEALRLIELILQKEWQPRFSGVVSTASNNKELIKQKTACQ
jgi:uncharacterized protein with von Willebrand factor type A (vWA) domain